MIGVGYHSSIADVKTVMLTVIERDTRIDRTRGLTEHLGGAQRLITQFLHPGIGAQEYLRCFSREHQGSTECEYYRYPIPAYEHSC